MKVKLVKIIMIAVVFAFFSAGVSMAQDWEGGRQNTPKANAYGHYKLDKNHKFEHNKHLKKYHGHIQYSKHYNCPQRRPAVLHNPHRHYGYYKIYRPHTGVAWALSVVEPNMAFSIGVMGR